MISPVLIFFGKADFSVSIVWQDDMQMSYSRTFLKRTDYYTAKIMNEQLGHGEDYDKIKPVPLTSYYEGKNEKRQDGKRIMKLNELEIHTKREGREQIFRINQKGSVCFQDGEQRVVKEAGAVTAAQIFFLIEAYMKERFSHAEEKASVMFSSDSGRDGWNMILTTENGQELFYGELEEINVGSTYLSAFIRQRIMIRNMMLFDGKETGLSFR